MIKVMYVINDAGLGGAEQSFLDMLTAFQNRISPIVIIPCNGVIEECFRKRQIVYYIVPFETDYREIDSHTGQEDTDIFLSSYRAALRLREIIRQEEIQMIHTNSSVSNAGAIAAMMENIPHIWHIREFLEEDFGSEFVNKELKKELFECADCIISISDCIKKAYKQKYNVESVRIYDGLDSGRFLDNRFLENTGRNFLLAGNIIPSKGQLEAVKAVHRLVKQGIETHLFIVGASGNDWYRWLLKKYVNEHELEPYVHILGFRKDLRKLREKCPYAVICSKMEALGRVTIEAMLGGCVVIGADTGGTAEIVGGGMSRGYLYKQGSEEDLARVMRCAAEQRERNKTIRKTAQAYALQEFELSKFADQVIDVYQGVLKRETDPKAEKKTELLEKLRKQYKEQNGMGIDFRFSVSTNMDKSLILKDMVQRWLRLKLEGRALADALRQREIYSAAIYGMGYLGCCLYDELESSGISIRYVLDRKLPAADSILRVVRMEEEFPETDAVIITVLGDGNSLRNRIKAKCGYEVILLGELMDWCEEG